MVSAKDSKTVVCLTSAHATDVTALSLAQHARSAAVLAPAPAVVDTRMLNRTASR